MIDVEKIRKLIEEAAPLPWFYNGYSAVFSKEMAKVHDEFWNDERFEDGHSYDRREKCKACGTRPVLDSDGNDTGRTYAGCARWHEADDAEAIAAYVHASYGDTATGWRAKNAKLIEEGLNALPELLAMHDRHVKMCAELGFCPDCGAGMPCEDCGHGL